MVTDNPRQQSPAEFDFDAGWLCLDFANTVPVHHAESGKRHPDSHPALETYADFVEWGRQAGQVDEETARRLLGNAGRDPRAAEAALANALRLREVIYRLVTAGVEEKQPGEGDLDAFNDALLQARSRLQLAHRDSEFVWAWKDLGAVLDAPLAPILESAAQLLTSAADLARVRHCAGDTCDCLFMDTSRNQSRRWCSMSGCGNRAKARRHYQRKRASP